MTFDDVDRAIAYVEGVVFEYQCNNLATMIAHGVDPDYLDSLIQTNLEMTHEWLTEFRKELRDTFRANGGKISIAVGFKQKPRPVNL